MKRLKTLIVIIALLVVAIGAPARAYVRYDDSTTGQMTALQAENQDLKARLATLENRLANLESRMNAIDAVVATFQKQVLEMQKIVVALFNKLLNAGN